MSVATDIFLVKSVGCNQHFLVKFVGCDRHFSWIVLVCLFEFAETNQQKTRQQINGQGYLFLRLCFFLVGRRCGLWYSARL